MATACKPAALLVEGAKTAAAGGGGGTPYTKRCNQEEALEKRPATGGQKKCVTTAIESLEFYQDTRTVPLRPLHLQKFFYTHFLLSIMT